MKVSQGQAKSVVQLARSLNPQTILALSERDQEYMLTGVVNFQVDANLKFAIIPGHEANLRAIRTTLL